MKYNQYILYILLLGILSSCAIGYNYPFGGAKSKKTKGGDYIVTYQGNQFNTAAEGNYFMKVKGAEVSIQNGSRYYSLDGSVSDQSNPTYAAIGNGYIVGSVVQPSGKAIVTFSKHYREGFIDALSVIEEAKKRGIKLSPLTLNSIKSVH